MAGEVSIRLSRVYEAHGRVFSEIRLRAPLLKDLDAIGDVAEYQPTPGGGVYLIRHEDRIDAYRDRLLVKGEGLPSAGDLADLDLRDALALREAVTGFFSAARQKPHETPPTP